MNVLAVVLAGVLVGCLITLACVAIYAVLVASGWWSGD